ncbi:DUF6541 family protein [Saccharomonospora sp.]|uniref:DUF6541 family protein n=1 Tax=Saccharomonospora sp. TaxID=33913 RepID=UPI0026273DAF|nr:DUF6541 family protein [Saccharomonospora sp.]
MIWWELAPAVVCTAAIVFLPGYLVARSWAVTGLAALCMAAPVSIGLAAGMAVLGQWVGLAWNISLVAGAAVTLALVGLLMRAVAPKALGLRERKPRSLRSRWTLLVHAGALLIPAVLLLRGLTRMIGAPENISQTYDNIFHLNAVRFILDSGSASSLTLGGMYSDGATPSMYPGAWHGLVSLVVQVSGVSIPAAVNAVTLVVGALVWPISCIFLATRATGTRPVPVLFAGALSAVFGTFPYLMVDFGVLYPFFLSLALLPAALALVAMATGVGMRDGTPRWLAALVLVPVAVGMALAHPSTFLALAVFAVPILVVALVRYRRGLAAERKATLRYYGLILLLLGYLAVGAVLWLRLRPSDAASSWSPVQTIPQAFGEVVAAGLVEQGPTWVAFFLTLVAFYLVTRRRFSWWVFGVYLLAAGLFIMVSAVRGDSPLRDFLTGVWYNDTRRLAGQLPMIIVVVCTIAATWLFSRSIDALSSRFPALRASSSTSTTSPRVSAVAFVVAAALGVAGQFSSVNFAIADGMPSYQVHDEAPVLSPDEYALLERLDEHVPPDEKIIANPWTGTALSYAIAGRRTLTPHVGGTIPPEAQFVMDNLDEIDTDPRVCSTIERLNSHYVLDFAGPQVHNRNVFFEGLASPAANPGLTKVDQEGTAATLYQVTGC